MTWLTLLLPASLICCRSPRTCCQGGGKGSKSVSPQLFSMMLTAASGHRYCKFWVVSVFLLLKNEFLPSRGARGVVWSVRGCFCAPVRTQVRQATLGKNFNAGTPHGSGLCTSSLFQYNRPLIFATTQPENRIRP